MTGLSIDVIKNQIRLSKMFAGSEAVSTKALKQVNKLTCTCEMYERMAKK